VYLYEVPVKGRKSFLWGIWLLVFFGLVLFPYSGEAVFKKKIATLPFKNTPDWKGTYDPGVLLSKLLKRELTRHPALRGISAPGISDPLDNQKVSAQFVLTGRILVFHTALPVKLESTAVEKKLARTAEVELEVNLVHGPTGRVMQRRVFRGKSDQGKKPLGFTKNSLNIDRIEFSQTSAGKVLMNLTRQITEFIFSSVETLALEAHIIEVNSETGDIIINVGARNGVEIRDDFAVYGVSLNYKDSRNKADLGDRYQKMGVVRVKNVQEGFSEVVIMAGEEFSIGDLVRAKLLKPVYIPEPVKAVPKKESHSILAEKVSQPKRSLPFKNPQLKRTTINKVNFFDVVGMTLEY